MDTSGEQAAAAFLATSADLALGAQFMGVTFDALFCGILICQLAHWLPQMQHDAKHIRALVACGLTAAFAATAYTWGIYTAAFVFDFGKYTRFASLHYLGWYATLDVLTVMPVQLIFTERSYKVNNRSKVVLVICLFLTFATGATAVAVTASTRGMTMMATSHTAKVLMLAWPSICCTTHIVITGTIIGGLLRNRTSDFNNTNKMIDRLIGMCLECQAPATAFAIATTMTIAVSPGSRVVPWIAIVHPKVFMIGAMAMINTRHTWRRAGKSFSRPETSGFSGASSRSNPIVVPVTTQTSISWSDSGEIKTPSGSFHDGAIASDVALVDFDTRSHGSAAPFTQFDEEKRI